MRRPGSIYKKLKEVKYRHLVSLYKYYLRRTPEICKYNCPYAFTGEDGKEHQIRLCLLHQKDPTGLQRGLYPHLVDVCQELPQSMKCNAFISRYTKDDVKKIFEEELKNKNIRAKKYPDVCALEWVLERSVVGFPPLNWFQKLYFTIKRVLVKNSIL